tara:strand:- start:344 stop:604 length:261 start_codon:yes stop_codon:yes gene_type:complete
MTRIILIDFGFSTRSVLRRRMSKMDVPNIRYIVENSINRIESELSLFRDEIVDPESDSVLHTAHIIVASLLEDMNRELEDIGGYPE